MIVVDLSVGGHASFRCPGCKGIHSLPVNGGAAPQWTYNGNAEKPTFSPSILATSGHYCSGHRAGDECWCTFKDDDGSAPFACYICHSFVKDGRIQFLGDCTHALAGQTVDLPPFDLPRSEVPT